MKTSAVLTVALLTASTWAWKIQFEDYNYEVRFTGFGKGKGHCRRIRDKFHVFKTQEIEFSGESSWHRDASQYTVYESRNCQATEKSKTFTSGEKFDELPEPFVIRSYLIE
jgi:hypothetical protein